MLVINSPEEQTFIFNQWSLDTIFWIGCNDMDQDGTWTCADDSEAFFTEGGDQNGYWSKFRKKSARNYLENGTVPTLTNVPYTPLTCLRRNQSFTTCNMIYLNTKEHRELLYITGVTNNNLYLYN